MRLARYWSSPPLIRGLVRALKTNGGPPASRGALVVRALREKVRLGFRQCWSSRLSRPGVCEGTLSVSVSVSFPASAGFAAGLAAAMVIELSLMPCVL